MGTPILLGGLSIIGILVVLAYLAPPDLWTPRPGPPKLSPGYYFWVAFAVFLVATIIEYGCAASPTISPVVPIVGVLIELAIALEVLRRTIGTHGNEHVLVMLAFGFATYLAAFGLLVSLTVLLPTSIPLIVLMAIFFQRLRKRYAPQVTPIAPLPPSLAPAS
jgi:hypothetical protein